MSHKYHTNITHRALSFSAPLDGSHPPTLLSLPAKRVALRAPAPLPGAPPLLIARSDANGEDLEGLAGAGLYDRCVCVRVGWMNNTMFPGC